MLVNCYLSHWLHSQCKQMIRRKNVAVLFCVLACDRCAMIRGSVSCSVALVMVAPGRSDCISSGNSKLLSCLHRRRFDPRPATGRGDVESSIRMLSRIELPLQALCKGLGCFFVLKRLLVILAMPSDKHRHSVQSKCALPVSVKISVTRRQAIGLRSPMQSS